MFVVIAALWTAVPAQAQAAREQPSIYDRIWTDFTQWYKNDDNPAVQQVLFTGRFQHDFATVSADQGDHVAGGHVERHSAQDVSAAGTAAVGLLHVAQLDHQLGPGLGHGRNLS